MSSSSLDLECIICLEKKEGFIAHLSCGHTYHYKCIQEWQKKTKNLKRSCCICESETEITNLVGEETEITNLVGEETEITNLVGEENELPIKNFFYCCIIL